MPEGDTIHRAASAMRIALAGKPMRRFDAPRLVGPVPQAGRVIEQVESRGKHLELQWDDGLLLDTNLRLAGSWHLYRAGERWRRPYTQMRAAIEVTDWVAVCFNAPSVETYRRPDRRRHPGAGRLGPDLCASDADLGHVVNLLLTYPEPSARLANVMLDHRVMRGVGNVDRCEVLWSTELSPFAPVGSLGERDAIRIVNTAATMLRANLASVPRLIANAGRECSDNHAVYGRPNQRCRRCGASIECRVVGEPRRILYWCPGCQTHLDPRLATRSDDTPMDPHPAAKRWLAELPWNRDAV